MVPNCLNVVSDLARQFPQEWRDAHNPSGGGPHTEAFIKRLAWVLHSTVDPRFGLNGKRGNPNDLSDDALNYRGEGPGFDPTNGRSPVTVIDVIVSAGSPSQSPGWQVFDERAAAEADARGGQSLRGPGAWVQPRSAAGSGGIVTPPSTDLARYWTTAHRVLVSRLAGASTVTAAQQLAHSFPGEGWGNKSSRPGSTVSNDVIGRQIDGHLVGVRIATNEVFYIDGQAFVPVSPVNHLGDAAPIDPPPVDPVDPPATPIDLAPLLGALQNMRGELVTLSLEVATLRQDVIDAVKSQSYAINASTTLFGRKTQIVGTIDPKN